jgi:hypothetical protein
MSVAVRTLGSVTLNRSWWWISLHSAEYGDSAMYGALTTSPGMGVSPESSHSEIWAGVFTDVKLAALKGCQYAKAARIVGQVTNSIIQSLVILMHSSLVASAFLRVSFGVVPEQEIEYVGG